MKRNRSTYTYILLIIGVIVLVNLVGDRFFLRLDFTADKRYTLSDATKNILQGLKKPVTVTAYFSEDLPQQFTQLRRDFREELIEYANRSNGKVEFDFINPNKDEATEQKAMQEGINPVLINVREKDQVKQQKAYLGAVVHFGDQKEVIPLVREGAAMEYALSTSIKKMTAENKPKIGLVQGHGEPSPNALGQAMQSLMVLYDVEPVRLDETVVGLDNYKTLLIISPADSFPPSHLARLDQFLSGGKNLCIALNRVNGDLQRMSGAEQRSGLESWLQSKGIRVNPDFVVDQNCGNITVNQQNGYMTFQSNLAFPYLPLITKFADHPVTKGLTSVMLQFPSSIDFTGQGPSVTFTPLAMTSDRSGSQPAPVTFNINRQWQPNDFQRSGITVAAVARGKLAGTLDSRLVVIADGDFAVNGEGQQGRQLPPDNVNLLVNSVDWLSDDTGLIDLRSKEVSSRPIDPMDDGKKALYKYGNFLLPILLILGIGFFRYQSRRNLRIRRMSEHYI